MLATEECERHTRGVARKPRFQSTPSACRLRNAASTGAVTFLSKVEVKVLLCSVSSVLAPPCIQTPIHTLSPMIGLQVKSPLVASTPPKLPVRGQRQDIAIMVMSVGQYNVIHGQPRVSAGRIGWEEAVLRQECILTVMQREDTLAASLQFLQNAV